MSRLSTLPPPVFRGNSTSSQSSLNESQEEPSFSAAMKAVISRKKKPEQTKPQSSSSSQEEAVSNSDYLEKPLLSQSANPLEFWNFFCIKDIGIAGFWNGIPSLFRYRPALEYRPVTDFYGIPAEGYLSMTMWIGSRNPKRWNAFNYLMIK